MLNEVVSSEKTQKDIKWQLKKLVPALKQEKTFTRSIRGKHLLTGWDEDPRAKILQELAIPPLNLVILPNSG